MKSYIIKYLIILLVVHVGMAASAQDDPVAAIQGKVSGKMPNGSKEMLIGASVYWANTNLGTVTDEQGAFSLNLPKQGKKLQLVVSFIGYKPDTFDYKKGHDHVEIILISTIDLDEVEIMGKRGSAYFSKASVFNIQNITGQEFKKAACCNLAESFETNASVDVSFSDAISGARQIHLLGLAGKYVQINFENMPILRGLSSTYGLTYVPGPWMESIQISKGASTVRNGYESITGQINYEYKKPDTAERFFFNVVGNHFGRGEVNVYSAHKLSEKLSTMVLGFGGYHKNKIDLNEDGFIDLPLSNSFQLMNRWKYSGEHMKTQFGVGYLGEERSGGQMGFDKHNDQGTTNAYGIEVNTQRMEAFWKAGIFFRDQKESTLALLTNYVHHDQESFFGLNNYTGTQNNLNSSFVFSSELWNHNHSFDAGVAFVYDQYEESFNDSVFDRTDIVPGVFFEYTYKKNDKLSLVIGLRDDYHNNFGNLFTPRLHVKFNADAATTFRLSAGKGHRYPNLFAENTSLLATSRQFVFDEKINMEEAWNYGLFVTREFLIGTRPLNFNIDFFRTDFINQLIVDLDNNSGEVHFYNLKGKSFSNNAQLEIGFEPIERMDLLLAYRISDVRATYDGELLEKPLSKRNKGLVNISYATKYDKWKFNYTLQYNGASRMPNKTLTDGGEEFSPDFLIMNIQLNKNFKHLELYAGVENITDFVQEDPILAYDTPFSNEFDASQVWGPIIGRKIYAGVRFKLN